MFMPILTDMFNYWFSQGAIPGSITKGMITLLKKDGKHVWEDLDNYRPITPLKILQLIISDLAGPEQNYTVEGTSIQDLHLVCEVLEGLEVNTEAALISLDQSKSFNRVYHQFVAVVLETARFAPKFRK